MTGAAMFVAGLMLQLGVIGWHVACDHGHDGHHHDRGHAHHHDHDEGNEPHSAEDHDLILVQLEAPESWDLDGPMTVPAAEREVPAGEPAPFLALHREVEPRPPPRSARSAPRAPPVLA